MRACHRCASGYSIPPASFSLTNCINKNLNATVGSCPNAVHPGKLIQCHDRGTQCCRQDPDDLPRTHLCRLFALTAPRYSFSLCTSFVASALASGCHNCFGGMRTSHPIDFLRKPANFERLDEWPGVALRQGRKSSDCHTSPSFLPLVSHATSAALRYRRAVLGATCSLAR